MQNITETGLVEKVEYEKKLAREAIISTILNLYDIKDIDMLRSRDKKRKCVEARFLISRGLKIIGMPKEKIYTEINRHRLSYRYGAKAIDDLKNTNATFRKKLAEIDKEFYRIRNEMADKISNANETPISKCDSGKIISDDGSALVMIVADKKILSNVHEWLIDVNKNSLTAEAKEFLLQIDKQIKESINQNAGASSN
jgi:hypothetical protein